jgi:hypothetical protein
MLQRNVNLPPQPSKPIADRNEWYRFFRRLNFGWEMILAVRRPENPCANVEKYVKYLLTSQERQPGG